MDYGDVFLTGIRFAWRNPALWLFGFLAGLTGGAQSASTEIDLSALWPSTPPVEGGFPTDGFSAPPENILELFTGSLPAISGVQLAALALAFLLLGILLWGLSVIGQGAIIGSAAADPDARIGLGRAFEYGAEYFPSLALISLGTGALVILAIVLISLPLFTNMFAAIVCLAPVVFIGAIVLSAIAFLAKIAVVTQHVGAIEAFIHAAMIVQRKLGALFVFGVIMLMAGGLFNIAVAVPLFAAMGGLLLSLGAGGIFGETADLSQAILTSGGLLILCLSPVLAVIQGFYQTWQLSTWTRAYQAISQG